MGAVVGRPGWRGSVRRGFWRSVAAGSSTAAAARLVGVAGSTAEGWFRKAGGMPPFSLAEPSGRYLTETERELIEDYRASGWGVRAIARALGRAPSTVGRELRRNSQIRSPGSRSRYRARPAQAKARARARRPKVAKLAADPILRALVQDDLSRGWSPEQIAARLRRDHPDEPELQVSAETIYQSLYVQGRGALRRELATCLRTGRALRRPQKRADARRPRIPGMVMISERPPEAADRAVPGHWEGDLILGAGGGSAIGTLVERSTRFVVLLHLPHRHGAEEVRDAMVAVMTRLPSALRRSLTWDQGIEMARHAEITVAADLPIYFCDPHSPWQRGSNENTNGLLRQYFPKGTDLSVHTPVDLAAVAVLLNGRPRKTLDWDTPTERFLALLSPDQTTGVATTT